MTRTEEYELNKLIDREIHEEETLSSSDKNRLRQLKEKWTDENKQHRQNLSSFL